MKNEDLPGLHATKFGLYNDVRYEQVFIGHSLLIIYPCSFESL